MLQNISLSVIETFGGRRLKHLTTTEVDIEEIEKHMTLEVGSGFLEMRHGTPRAV